MRKALIAAIVATALFAVGAFAANFTTSSEDVASGADSVIACADEVDLKFAPGGWNDDTDLYETASVTASFWNGTEESRTVANTCNGLPVTILVDLDDGTEDESGLINIAAGTATYAPTGGWAVSRIEAAAVLVEDVLITDSSGSPFVFEAFGD